MENPLTSLDELIWKQFEKVTIAAEKHLGWDKYDLAEKMGTTCTVSLVGAGVYSSIYALQTDFSYGLAFGIITTLMGPIHYKAQKGIIATRRVEELSRLVEESAPEQPIFNPVRPMNFSYSALCAGLGYVSLREFDHPALGKGSPSPEWLSVGLLYFAVGAGMLFHTSVNYFLTQIPKPPATKKSLRQAIHQWLFPPKPQEVKVTVQQYDFPEPLLSSTY